MSKERKLLNNIEQGNDKLTEMVYLSLLYDFYGELLGEHKKQIFEEYVLNDLSLSEVADETGLSRQGVYDIIKRCTVKLKEYEEKLHLVQKFEQTKQKVNQIKQISIQMKEEKIAAKISEITEISDKVAEASDKIIEISDEILKEL